MDNEVVINVRVDDNVAAADMIAAGKKLTASAGKIGDDSGKSLGDALFRGLEGKLRDAQSRFASSGKKLGDGLGSSSGDGFQSSLLGRIKDVVPKIGGFLTGPLETIGVTGGEALAYGLAAAAPLIGASISAAVIGGAGSAGVLGGVLLATRDPAVKSAGVQLGHTLMSGLESASASFIHPVLQNIDKIGDRFQGLLPRITGIFSNSSKFLDPLVDGVLDAVDGVLRGVDTLTAKAGPVMNALGRGLGEVGQSVGDAFEMIAGDSEDAADALGLLLDVTADSIRAFGALVRGLTEAYGFLDRVGDKINSVGDFINDKLNPLGIKDTADATKQLTRAQNSLADQVLTTGEAAGSAGMQMSTYGDKMDDAASKGQGFFDSQTNVARSIRDAEDALKKNGRGLGTNTEKQLANRDALSKVAHQLVATYDGFVKLNGEGAAAADMASRNRGRFVSLAMQFGQTRSKAEALADSMGLIKDKKIAFYANTHDAAGRISALKGQIGGVHGKTVTVHVSVTGTERLDALGHRIGGYKASGGVVGAAANGATSAGMTLVGEHGPELLDLPPGTSVNSNPDTERMLGGGGGGGAVGVFTWDKAGTPGLVRAIMETLRLEIRTQGGNVQQVLG